MTQTSEIVKVKVSKNIKYGMEFGKNLFSTGDVVEVDTKDLPEFEEKEVIAEMIEEEIAIE